MDKAPVEESTSVRYDGRIGVSLDNGLLNHHKYASWTDDARMSALVYLRFVLYATPLHVLH